MANLSIARGLMPVRHANGAPYSGSGNIYYIPATNNTALYIGDPVIPVTAAGDANGIPTITQAAAGSGTYIIGSVVGIVAAGDPPVTKTRDMLPYRAASVAAYVMVADDPDLIFEIQADANLAITASSRNADLVSGTGSVYTGYSGWQLSASSLQTTNTLQLRIMRPAERADNDVATASVTAQKWLVKINLHSLRNTTGI